MKLYPPIIEGTLPAFYGSIIKVPFTMNKSVSKQDIDGFALKIKTVQNQINISKEAIIVGTEAWDKNSNIINFNIEDNIQSKLNVGQFYKVQLAYVNGEDIGYYSTIGVIKYTSDPLLSLSSEDGQTYSGIYSQKLKDISEKLYSYSFTLIDSLNNIIETSGEQIHNSSNDTNSYESINLYTINTDLEKNKIYHLIYKIKTINGLEKTIQTKGFSSIENIDSSLKVNIICNVNCEEGSIDIGLEPLEEQFVSGTYYLLRSSNENNFKSWSEIFNFSLHGKKLPKQLFKDMAIKQGVRYKYAIQQYNSHGLRTKRVETKYSVQADFEHSYLYDGERQLKIKYNPKVTSFKTTLMETKIDTIGNKHPFIFRNGTVEYKEFPISGLISCLSDENKMFDIDLFYDNNDVENLKQMF